MVSLNKNKFFGALVRVEEAIISCMKWSIILGMAGMVLVVFLQITSRYIFSFSLGWSEEVARLLFICIVFLGAAILARREQHLTVTIFTEMLQGRLQHVAAVLASLVGLICSYYLMRGGYATLIREWDQRTPSLQFPMGVVFAIILISVTLMTIWLFVVMIKHTRQAIIGDES
ncbi:TRAP transporter small permease [Ahrensia kielensis]|uniref:TRAP transporter small permease protein n=1 Tax=Ahrensia kielensis TaxID=76980 RepID=A0ABU9T3R7_9HYPH